MNTAPGLESREPDVIEQPAPTVWPMVTALGVTMMFGGLVTHVLVSAVGLLLSLIAAVGWWKDVLWLRPRISTPTCWSGIRAFESSLARAKRLPRILRNK